jgi:pentatricopeptide repeat protein
MPTPDKISYTTVIDAWARAGNANRAEALLREMEELSQKPNSSMVPDIIAYTTVLSAYSQQKHDVNKALQLFERMQRFCPEMTTSAGTYNTLIHWIAKSNGDSMQAEAILRHMVRNNVKPCVITYTTVISCHANHGRAHEAETLFEEMLDRYERTGHVDYLPNVKTFASLLYAWAKSGAPEALERAHLLLHRMDELDIKPNTIVFGQILYILSNSRTKSAADRAERLLEKMEILAIENQDMRPDATTFAYLINAYTKSGIETAADRAAQVLAQVEERYDHRGETNLKPTSLLYSAVLQAFAKSASPGGAERAEELLQRNKGWYHRDGKEYARPTTLCYNAVMDAHARSGTPRAAERAQQLLDEMEKEAGLTPTTRSFNAAILAWKNSKNPDTVQAEALLKRMNERYKAGDVGCKPDSVTINSIIGVWAKSGQPQAGKRAKAFLDFMERAYKAGDGTLKPDTYSFNSVMDAYAQSGDGRRAQKLFERMKNLCETTGDEDLKPDRITFTALKNAWIKSTDSDAPEKLARVVELMQDYLGVE